MTAEQDEMLERATRDRRRSGSAVAVFVIAAGAFLMLRQSGHAPVETRVLGLAFLLLGTVSIPWIWQRDWSQPDAERLEHRLQMSQRAGLIFRGIELLMITLALLGLVFPAEFGEYWQKHQLLIMILAAGLVSRVITRAVRWRTAQIADSELP